MNECRSVAVAMINGGSEHMDVKGNGRGQLENTKGEWL